MISDEDASVRKLGVRRIIKTRKNEPTDKIRDFKVPSWNLTLLYTINELLINWKSIQITSPPVSSHLSDAGLKSKKIDQLYRKKEGQLSVPHSKPLSVKLNLWPRLHRWFAEVSRETDTFELNYLHGNQTHLFQNSEISWKLGRQRKKSFYLVQPFKTSLPC